MAEQRRIVIIGGGIAGLSAAQAARQTDPAARVSLVCGEAELPYYRTRIPELINGADPEKLSLRSHQWYIDNDIQVVRTRATAIVSDNRQVRFADGSYLYYDSCVIAAGASALVPETAYAHQPGAGPLRDRKDVERIMAHPGPAVVVGDGLLAMEAAWQLSREGRDVTILGRGAQLLSKQLEREASVFYLHAVEQLGVHIALRGELAALENGRAYLADGRAFDAATVVFATGIRSNVKLGQSAGAALDRGIIVDRQMRTSVEGVFAAGDCAELEGRTLGLWTAAMAQGQVAGANAAGDSRVYLPSPPVYSLRARGLELLSCGDLTCEDQFTAVDSSRPAFGKLFFRGGRLAGAELIGPTLPMVRAQKAVEQGISREDALAMLNDFLSPGK
ncbi:MAG: NAD(P)/FAD-dependent oxidoreductase [Oscillospiraceae bacterium]|nr:NAD(P)/FAD-dependent oxidoreductase [Oscillospiraceae bacterium]